MKYAPIPERSLEPPDESPPVTYCPGCGKELYEGDKYYPALDVCEHCINKYLEKVSA